MYVLQEVQCISGLGIVVFFMERMFSQYLSVRFLLVWPMYALLRVLHVSLYMPLLSWSCVVSWILGLVSCCSVFVLLKAIFM